MISRIVLACVVAVAVGLLLTLLGLLLGSLPGPVAIVGHFLATYAWLIGLLAGLWYFFSGATWWPRGPRRTVP